MTYRQLGHSRSDPGKYRPAGELESWLARDPITVAEQRLRELGVAAADLDKLRDDAAATVRDAADRAMSWADPDPAERFEDVLA
jgi:pyruvate dehydrogenase E1 component alpha subunit